MHRRPNAGVVYEMGSRLAYCLAPYAIDVNDSISCPATRPTTSTSITLAIRLPHVN